MAQNSFEERKKKHLPSINTACSFIIAKMNHSGNLKLKKINVVFKKPHRVIGNMKLSLIFFFSLKLFFIKNYINIFKKDIFYLHFVNNDNKYIYMVHIIILRISS